MVKKTECVTTRKRSRSPTIELHLEESDDECVSNSNVPKPKRTRASYELVTSFETLADVDAFIRLNTSFNLKITHNEPVPCSFCKSKVNDHLMEQIYKKCKCGSCDLKYAIRSCQSNRTLWLLYQSGSHQCDNIEPCVNYDIPLVIKELFKQFLHEDNSLTAKKLLTRVTILREENELRPLDERVKKYSFDAKLLPSLNQVIN